MHTIDFVTPPAVTAGLALVRMIWPNIPKRLLPVAAVVVGVAASVGAAHAITVAAIGQGVVYGLVAIGLWNGAAKPVGQMVRRVSQRKKNKAT